MRNYSYYPHKINEYGTKEAAIIKLIMLANK